MGRRDTQKEIYDSSEEVSVCFWFNRRRSLNDGDSVVGLTYIINPKTSQIISRLLVKPTCVTSCHWHVKADRLTSPVYYDRVLKSHNIATLFILFFLKSMTFSHVIKFF